jgi:hypothetical protein
MSRPLRQALGSDEQRVSGPALDGVLLAVRAEASRPRPSAQDTTGLERKRRCGDGLSREHARPRKSAVTVIVVLVWAVSSDAAGWLSGWRRADPRVLCRLV